jgi:hypothetical protein
MAKVDADAQAGIRSIIPQKILKIIWNKWNSIATARTCDLEHALPHAAQRRDSILKFQRAITLA